MKKTEELTALESKLGVSAYKAKLLKISEAMKANRQYTHGDSTGI
jgi:hypothetical protein